MRISNKIGSLISDISSWENAFKEVDRKVHWKKGRSAYALAEYFTNPLCESSKGEQILTKCLKYFGFKNVKMDHAEIEHESKFDEFRGQGRMQDMIIWANSEECPIAICVEAKVDETFNNTMPEAYKLAKEALNKNPESRAVDRINLLCYSYYNNKKAIDLTDIRYQLLYYLAGSITEAIKIKGAVFMPIMVFHTNDFNTEIGNQNKSDYIKFMKSLSFESVESDEKNILLYKSKIKDVDVYSAYIEI